MAVPADQSEEESQPTNPEEFALFMATVLKGVMNGSIDDKTAHSICLVSDRMLRAMEMSYKYRGRR